MLLTALNSKEGVVFNVCARSGGEMSCNEVMYPEETEKSMQKIRRRNMNLNESFMVVNSLSLS